MKQIIKLQGANKLDLNPGKYSYEFKSNKNGKIKSINNKIL